MDTISARLADYLESSPTASLEAVGYSLATEAPHPPHRRVLFARDREDAVRVLRAGAPHVTVAGVAPPKAPEIGFMFPGVVKAAGLREIYDVETVFREQFDRCAAFAEREYGVDLRSIFDTASTVETPAYLVFLFAVETGLSALWKSWGVRPCVLLGFSFGELVAAFAGGVFSLEDALTLVAERSRLLGALPPGAMTSVALAEADTRPLLSADLAVAIQRSPRSCVVSGPVTSMVAFEERLRKDGISHQRLDMWLAGHSAATAQAAEPFAQAVGRAGPRAPRLPIVSGVSGELLTEAQAISPAYWGSQLHETVRFASGVETMIRKGCRVLLEVGPGYYLTSMASQQGAAAQGVVFQPSVRPASGEPGAHLGLMRSLARLWTIGVDVDWRAFYAETSPPLVSLRHLWSP